MKALGEADPRSAIPSSLGNGEAVPEEVPDVVVEV